MKTRTIIMLAALVALLSTAVVAEAGKTLRESGKRRAERELKTWRFNRAPAMNFVRGTLQRDLLTGWEIGDVQVRIAPKCRIEGESSKLREGDEVMIMGARAGATIVAWNVRVIAPAYTQGQAGSEEKVVWSTVDRTVGEGSGPE